MNLFTRHPILALVGVFAIECAAQIPPIIEQQVCLGGPAADEAKEIAATPDGGFVIVGTTLSNSGQVSGNHGGIDAWLAKLDANFNLQWQRCYGGPSDDQFLSVKALPDGGFIACGTNSGGGDVVGYMGLGDAWVVRLDANGDIMWQHSLGGGSGDYAYNVTTTADGGFIMAGYSASPEFDPMHYQGNFDAMLVKFYDSGAIHWKRFFGSPTYDTFRDVVQTSDGGYVATGHAGLDGGEVSGNHGDSDVWLVKVSAWGMFEWQRCLGGSLDDHGEQIISALGGGFMIAAWTRSSNGDVSGYHALSDLWLVRTDAEGQIIREHCYGGLSSEEFGRVIQLPNGKFSAVAQTLSSDGQAANSNGWYDILYVSLAENGELEWTTCLGSSDAEGCGAIIAIPDDKIIIAGSTLGNDDDVAGNHGSRDAWVVKTTHVYNRIRGTAFADLNSNAVQDSGEPAVSAHQVLELGLGRQAFTNNTGAYDLVVPTAGTFTATPAPLPYYSPVPAERTVSFPSTLITSTGNDFALQPTGAYNDLAVHVTPVSAFRPGMLGMFNIHYCNVGTTTLSSTITLTLDAQLDFLSAFPVPADVSGNTITWALPALPPFGGGHITVGTYVDVSAALGMLLISTAQIDPAGTDDGPVDNSHTTGVVVTGSFDPNDIQVNRDWITTDELPALPVLQYLIRFQNTGTDTAFTVRIKNPLPANADPISFEIVSASHQVELDYENAENTMWFNFYDILLPDSNTNEMASHGYVRYQLRADLDLVAGDSILNDAAIYFDYNTSVLTNTAVTEVLFPSGLNSASMTSDLELAPNPARELLRVRVAHAAPHARVIIRDGLGRVVIDLGMPGTLLQVDTSALPKGIYVAMRMNGGSVSTRTFAVE